MHIAEGVLSVPVLSVGAATAALGIWLGLRRLDESRLILAAVLAATFFLGSLIHVPLGPGSVHLLLGGMVDAFACFGGRESLLLSLMDDSGDADVSGEGGQFSSIPS